METIENGFGGRVHDGVPASSLWTLATIFKPAKMTQNSTFYCIYMPI